MTICVKFVNALSISGKMISKWECGKGLLEISLMLPLCETLDITVNDLLSGEKFSSIDYQKIVINLKRLS